ncbi:MAG: DNA-binding protein [Pirellulales bacterium]|nr:DNA-binding protein [Pirellulales bacterium]
MKITLELPENESIHLADTAQRLGIEPEELAQAALSDFLNQDRKAFLEAVEYVLEKNHELYRRLS